MTHTRRTLLAIACTGAMAFAGSASAAGSAVLGVITTIVGTCSFSSNNYLLAFGLLDPSTTADATQSVAVSYKCTNGVAASSIKIDGQNSPYATTIGTTRPPSALLPVVLSWTTPTTAGNGFGAGATDITFNISGTIAAADINAALVGQYFSRFFISLLP